MAATDIASCFEAIPHERLMQALEERARDRKLLKLLARAVLGAGVMEDGVVRGAATGTPQEGVISALLRDVYLHRLDRAWQAQRYGRLVRSALTAPIARPASRARDVCTVGAWFIGATAGE